DGDIGRCARGQAPALYAEHLRGVAGDAGERLGERQLSRLAPLEGQRQKQLQARRAGLGFGERQVLSVLVDRGVVRAGAIDRTLLEAAGQRIAIALAAKRRLEPAVGGEVAEVELAEKQAVDADSRSDAKPNARG